MTQAREMAGPAQQAERLTRNEPPTGPIRLPIASEKPIHIPNLSKDRLGTFDFISWWDREKVQNAKVMVIGAGALGNEVIKNLALMGIGHIFIVDFDKIEAANLSRSVLFARRITIAAKLRLQPRGQNRSTLIYMYSISTAT